jgi:hypothetical protein
MNTGAILIGIAMLVFILPFVTNPFLNKTRKRIPVSISKNSGSNNQTQEILLALRDLDFDYQLGKVSAEDYSNFRAQLMITAAQAIEATENVQGDQLEEMIRSRRQTHSESNACNNCGEQAGANYNFCPHCGEPQIDICPECNQKIVSGDAYCAACGTALKHREDYKQQQSSD